MGEEELNQQSEEQESALQQTEETGLVKRLRNELEEQIKINKQIQREIEKLREYSSVSSLEEIQQRLENLEFENFLLSEYPDLKEEKDKIKEFRKINESWEDAVLRYLGKKAIEQQASSPQGFSLRSQQISTNLGEVDYSKLPLEELKKKAEEEFRKMMGG